MSGDSSRKHSQFNLLIRIGMWTAVISAALYVGGKIINQVETYLPYAFIAGALLMIIGFFLAQRKESSDQTATTEG